ncbi:FTR1 family iron permease [Chitinilyticum piscinae]|uniref:FTR1 family protein n=1 Tax=Chitinilyticum piscinae TaxID=2866724 RepID=A0A8J7FUN6_9NEIS|nr:FTR1 family protein [Chitinilyticum piscinae]MBE9610926.1 FTR1 family protein [Chitinilyticum piscinae]
MEQVAFIVWRESVEALLVIGILYAWIRQSGETRAMPYLWGGVGAGLALSALLATALLGMMNGLSDALQEYLLAAMPIAACALIVQMVVWMRRNGRTLRSELEQGMASKAARANWWGLLMLVALAVAREGSETVVFLYGSIAGQAVSASFFAAAGAGFMAALATFWALQSGGRWISWRAFFRISEIMLLLLAGAMLNTGIERLIGNGVLPALIDPLWDSSALLDDSAGLGKALADFAGYRAHPALLLLIVWGMYWLASLWLLTRQNKPGAQ